MWFKNIKTGNVWEILDVKLQEELKKDSNFISIELNNEPVKKNNPNQTKDMKCEICDKTCKGQRSYTQHMRMAHGINKDGDK